MRAAIVAVSFLLPLIPCRGQDDFVAFRAGVEQRLRAHAFFSRITFTLVERPPFLFCIERPSVDEKDYDLAIVNGYLPYLQEVLSLFETNYRAPAQLERRPEAGGFALAVLASGGRYVDFRTAIGDPSLALARAHYTPSLRVAVTYQDSFSRFNTKGEERHALLHEFVHALQHAYSAGDTMPKPVWFNEGLADYRASSTGAKASLREPPLQSNHVDALAFAYGNPAGRFYVAPLAELVAADSYQDVLAAAKQRNGADLPPRVLLPMFYSEAEMFVRFLHEGQDGRYRDGFVRYLQAAQRGESGLGLFERAFGLSGADALAKLESEWLVWLDGVLRKQHPRLRDLTKGAAAEVGGAAAVPMLPPTPFDTTGLGWTAADFEDRLDGARRLCANGEYEAALQLLPADAEAGDERKAFLQRERARIGALLKLRDDALADLSAGGAKLSVTVGGERITGTVVRREDERLVLRVGSGERTVPLNAMSPIVLKVQAGRMNLLKGTGAWLEVWTRWLEGDPLSRLKGLLKLDYSTMADLRTDLTQDFDPQRGTAAAALVELLRLPQQDDVEAAAAALQRLRELVRAHGKTPLLQRRKAAIDALARSFAERAFRPGEPSALGVHGDIVRTEGGALTVTYTDALKAPAADFVSLSPEELQGVPQGVTRIAFGGQSGLSAAQGGYQLIGSTWIKWAVPLRGPQAVEMQFVIEADFVPDFGLAMCMAPGRMMLVYPSGGVQVLDVEQQVVDAIGGGAMLEVGKTHRLRIEHDGTKNLRVSLDGKETAHVTDVGRLTAGNVCLFVHSSTPVRIPSLSITGMPDPSDPQVYRDRWVGAVLGGLWP